VIIFTVSGFSFSGWRVRVSSLGALGSSIVLCSDRQCWHVPEIFYILHMDMLHFSTLVVLNVDVAFSV
jgi:hypothetical protein